MESISSKPPTKLARCENFSERQIKKRKWKFVDICLRKFDIWTIIKSKSSCFILLLFNYDFMFIYHYHCTLFYFNLGICSRYLLWYIAPLQPEKIVHKVYQIWLTDPMSEWNRNDTFRIWRYASNLVYWILGKGIHLWGSEELIT